MEKPHVLNSLMLLKVEVPISKNLKPVEQFTIYFDEQFGNINIFLAWDDIVVPVSIQITDS